MPLILDTFSSVTAQSTPSGQKTYVSVDHYLLTEHLYPLPHHNTCMHAWNCLNCGVKIALFQGGGGGQVNPLGRPGHGYVHLS